MFEVLVIAIVALPLLAAISNGVNLALGERYSYRVVHRLARGAILLSFIGAVGVFATVLFDPTPREVVVYRWMTSGDLGVDIAFLIDSLSSVMMLVTTGIGFLVAVFSVNYMHNERGFSRFFTVVPLFVFAMLVLVMANNYVLLFVGWESVGVCSYLLISYYYERPASAKAGTKAFVMNRIGDAGFLIGIFLIIATFQTTDYSGVFPQVETASTGTLTAIGLCLLVGAAGKSAQLPLTTWLAKAMEGPTPSSALFYAATMVTAGVYMIARSHPIFDLAPNALLAVAIVGAATALFGAIVGLVQTDIKSVLIYSTTSQLGLMFLACGLGAYPVAIFHLTAHAFFRTLLFLTAPSILHHLHGGADPRKVGRANAGVPVAYQLLLVAAVGLLAFPFLSVWWSGDVFGTTFSEGIFILLAVGAVAAFAAAFAAGRMVYVAFFEDSHGESGGSVWAKIPAPLGVLAILGGAGVAVGILPGGLDGTWFGAFLAPVISASPGVPEGSAVLVVALLVLMVMLLGTGWFASLYLDRFRPERPGLLFFRTRAVYNLALNRFWLDELYDALFVRTSKNLGRVFAWFDSSVIDRATGVPEPARRLHVARETWEERRLISDAAEPTSTWEEEEEMEGRSAPSPGVLGWLTRVGGESSTWVEREGVGRAPGILGAVTKVGGDASDFIERGIRRAPGVLGWLAGLSGSISTFIERGIDRAPNLLDKLTEAIVAVSAWVEKITFTGVHVGMPGASGGIGRILTRTEEVIGRPVVIGSIVMVSLAAVLMGALWL
jgi:NADH-quinone oxidoreductase subunit L